MGRSRDIRARTKASAIGRNSCRRGRSQEDDHNLTFDTNEFGVREPISAEIGLALFEKRSNRRTHRRTDRQTDRHISFIYIEELQCPASPGFLDLQTLFAINDRQTGQTERQTVRLNR